MLYQEKPGIYVYSINNSGLDKIIQFSYYENWIEFYKSYSYRWIQETFGTYEDIWKKHKPITNRYSSYNTIPDFYYAAYDENGNWFSPDRIVGFHSQWLEYCNKRNKKRLHNRRHGRKKPVWGHYLRITGVGVRRNDYEYPEFDELGIHVKYRRKAVTPDPWSVEKWTHNEKCWKKQSKKSHQWE